MRTRRTPPPLIIISSAVPWGLTWLPFCLIRNKSDFDDETARLIGEAFDAVCKDLDDTGQPALVREIIAKRIIEAAKKGERDPVRLRNAGLTALDTTVI